MRLVIIGAGFAGMYAALSAARLRDIQGVSPEELEIALVAPEPTLVVRPRLYEPKPETLTAPLLDVLKAIDVDYVQGSAETIDTKSRTVQIVDRQGHDARPSPTTGWSWPPAAGCSVRTFPALPSTASASTRSTMRLRSTSICMASPTGRPSNGRDTVVVAGGGFTGIEAATEMPARLREILGKDAKTARHHRRSQQRDRARHGRQAPAPSSRTPCASSAWRPGSAPASPRSTNPASRCPAANTSKPRP